MGQLRQSAHGSLDGVQLAPRDLVAGVIRDHPGNIGKILVHARVPDQSVDRHDSAVEFRLGRRKQIVDPFKPFAFRGRQAPRDGFAHGIQRDFSIRFILH